MLGNAIADAPLASPTLSRCSAAQLLSEISLRRTDFPCLAHERMLEMSFFEEGLLMQRLLFVALLLMPALTPRPAAAMEIAMFDRLANQDQRDYIRYLVNTAQKVLIEEGRGDLATRVVRLFEQVDHWSPGEVQLRAILVRLRDLTGPQLVGIRPVVGQVEDGFVQTLVGNDIRPPNRFHRRFSETLREKPCWPRRPLS